MNFVADNCSFLFRPFCDRLDCTHKHMMCARNRNRRIYFSICVLRLLLLLSTVCVCVCVCGGRFIRINFICLSFFPQVHRHSHTNVNHALTKSTRTEHIVWSLNHHSTRTAYYTKYKFYLVTLVHLISSPYADDSISIVWCVSFFVCFNVVLDENSHYYLNPYHSDTLTDDASNEWNSSRNLSLASIAFIFAEMHSSRRRGRKR